MNTYIRLAWTGITKNRRLYIPYLLTCIGMTAMFYIVDFLPDSTIMEVQVYQSILRDILVFGSGIIAFFSLIFLFYTNSFLIRRRAREFGLYNILGMGKNNIARLLLWETLIVAAISITGGLFFGILLSKLAELLLAAVIDSDISYAFSVSLKAVRNTALIFAVIFVLIFFRSLLRIGSSSAASLVKSDSYGEKPPKANWVLGLLGVVLLGGAYYMAVAIDSPLDALIWFFIAVLMVIAATYLLFAAGSVLLCRLLQKNKKYYYNPRHFVSVSSMVYRMKRNGAGLASICILATMVLVMLSSTSCLYFGVEDSLSTRYPRDISSGTYINAFPDMENITSLRGKIADMTENIAVPESRYDYLEGSITGFFDGDILDPDPTDVGFSMNLYSDVYEVHFVTPDEILGESMALGENEAVVFTTRKDYPADHIEVKGGKRYTIVRRLEDFTYSGAATFDMMNHIYVIVPDLADATEDLAKLADYSGDPMMKYRWYYGFDCVDSARDELAIRAKLYDLMENELDTDNATLHYVDSLMLNREDFYSTYGGLFFLGIMLSLVFLCAAVLIIYYKQVSEGYEDIKRFDIMQKVGMTKKDIRMSINSQMLTVFLLPLCAAGLHLGFAFPLIRKLLALFNLTNTNFLIVTTIISFAAFALFYMIVYRITSNAYYHIVSEAKE